MKLPFTEPYTKSENGKDPTKTGYSCHIKKDQSHTSTFTAYWFLREGQGRDLLGEWMKLTSKVNPLRACLSQGHDTYRRTHPLR